MKKILTTIISYSLFRGLRRLFVLCLLVFGATLQANAQSKCIVGNNQNYNYNYPLGNSVHIFGQSFTTNCAGLVDYIDVETLFPNWNANLNFVLYENNGFNGNELSNQNYSIVSDDNGTFRFTFPSPIILNGNTVYTFAVHNNEPLGISFKFCDYNPYAGGEVFINEFGNSTYDNINLDMVFNAHVTPYCSATSSTYSVTACSSFTWADKNNTVYTTSNNTDTAMLTNAEGCDSIVTLDLTLNQAVTSTTSLAICASQLPYNWNGLTFNAADSQTTTITSTTGCDSVVTLILSINPPTTSITNITICGAYYLPYTWNGLVFNDAGTQTATLTNAAGCDSLATLNLTVDQLPVAGTITSSNGINSVCVGSTISLSNDGTPGGNWYINSPLAQLTGYWTLKGITPGTVQVDYLAFNSCGTDRVSYYFDVNAPTINTTTISNCGAYTWAHNGRTYTASGTYSGNTADCVTEVLNLTINNSSGTNTTLSACNSYTWANNGQTYNNSGTYYYNYTSSTGCMSVDTLNLTINIPTSNTTTITACNSYTWANNGQTYTTSGTYKGTTSNCVTEVLNLIIENPANAGIISGGNISTCVGGQVTLTITGASGIGVWSSSNTNIASVTSFNGLGIVNSIIAGAVGIRYAVTNICGTANAFTSITFLPYTNNTTNIVACKTYTWANNGQTYTTSGTYTGTTANCVTQVLNLTITQPTTTSFTVSSCNSYTWAAKLNKVYTANNTTDTIKLIGAGGCDSIVRLNLTITPITTITTTISACNSYTWANNGQTYTSSGTYTGTTTNCVTARLVLTINKPKITSASITACNSYKWPANNQTYTASGTYINNYTNANGCPSADTVKLTLIKNSRTNITACSSYVWFGTTYTSAGTYTRSYTNANGCVMVDTLGLKIFSDTFQNIKITAAKNSICVNERVQLSVNYSGSGGVWDVQNVGRAYISASGLVTGLSGPATAIIRYTITDAAGCKSPAIIYNIAVNTIPTVPQITGTSSNICAANATLQYNNTLAGGVWSSSDTSRATISNTGLITGKKPGSPDITYTVNVNGCTNSNTRAVNIGIISPSTAPSSNLCLGRSFTLKNADNVYGNNGVWTIVSGPGQVLRNIGELTGTGVGTVVVKFNATVNGCNLSTNISINVTATTATKPSVTARTNTFCTKTSYLLTANQPNGVWSSQTFKAYIQNTTNSLQCFASSDTAAAVTIRFEGPADANGCRAFTDFTRTFTICGTVAKTATNNNVSTSKNVSNNVVVEEAKKIALNIYPNPVVNTEVIFNSNASSGTYIITNMMGKVMLTTKLRGRDTKLSLGNLAKGMYVVTLVNNKECITKQMVKE